MDIDDIRARALRAMAPVKAADERTPAAKDFLFSARRAEASGNLPPYYLVYFLLVDLLGFRELGRFEKVAWSVPVEYDGRAFLVEHRKFGLGLFAGRLPEDEAAAMQIARHINKAAKAAQPYFEWRAQQAAKGDGLNVVNRSRKLFERFEFYLDLYRQRQSEAEVRADERVETRVGHALTIEFPAYDLRQEARWFALSAIECFFSWTEHVFVHIAIISGKASTGEEVAELARADWGPKFQAALDVSDRRTKVFYDELTTVRRQLRNFVAHGAFGKDGEAFHFHSAAGAVPLLLPHKRQPASFRFGQGVDIESNEVVDLIGRFITHLWDGERAPAKLYVQDYQLPLILSEVTSGAYAKAMSSVDAMEHYAGGLARRFDDYANMDF